MDNLKWRKGAKFVGYFDLIVASLGIFGVFLLVGLILSGEWIILNNEIVEFWICIGIVTPECLLLIWAGKRLMNATDIESDPAKALKISKVWRILTIFFLIADILYVMVTGEYIDYIITLIWLVIRGIFLWIVSKFIFELKNALNTIPNLAQVTVKM